LFVAQLLFCLESDNTHWGVFPFFAAATSLARPHLLVVEDVGDDGVDIGDVDFKVIIHIIVDILFSSYKGKSTAYVLKRRGYTNSAILVQRE
jgi:hypothetical protein